MFTYIQPYSLQIEQNSGLFPFDLLEKALRSFCKGTNLLAFNPYSTEAINTNEKALHQHYIYRYLSRYLSSRGEKPLTTNFFRPQQHISIHPYK